MMADWDVERGVRRAEAIANARKGLDEYQPGIKRSIGVRRRRWAKAQIKSLVGTSIKDANVAFSPVL